MLWNAVNGRRRRLARDVFRPFVVLIAVTVALSEDCALLDDEIAGRGAVVAVGVGASARRVVHDSRTMNRKRGSSIKRSSAGTQSWSKLRVFGVDAPADHKLNKSR